MKWCDICGSALVVIDTKSVCSNTLGHGYHRDFTSERISSMTGMTTLARKLWDTYNDAGCSHVKAWNKVAEAAEAELATPHPVRLPTVKEAHQAISDRYEAAGGYITGNYWDWCASAVLDLAAKLNPTWVPVPNDTTIPEGTLVRTEHDGNYTSEQTIVRDWRSNDRINDDRCYYVPSGTKLVTSLADIIRDAYVKLAKAAAEALGVTL